MPCTRRSIVLCVPYRRGPTFSRFSKTAATIALAAHPLTGLLQVESPQNGFTIRRNHQCRNTSSTNTIWLRKSGGYKTACAHCRSLVNGAANYQNLFETQAARIPANKISFVEEH